MLIREKSDDIEEPKEKSASPFCFKLASEEENKPSVKLRFVKYAITRTTIKKIPIHTTQYAGWEKTLRKLRNIVVYLCYRGYNTNICSVLIKRCFYN